ncbi:DUF3558 domain-containing protein [Pseudonocardia nigra]|uniref:DUF3558 domain-containing protein n=1 Tax=Pseudonocardia nigra TaxID=1921578 RepID=UPI001C5D4531|nr:DUF3558 domain-containing protein [Pseudonocardia nigra]
MRRAVLLIAAAALLAACTTEAPGKAEPAPTSSAPTGLVLPPRPFELPLDGVDPCSLLTPDQRESIGLTDDVLRSASSAPGFTGPTCTMQGYEPRAISVEFALATSNGIEVLTESEYLTDELTPITVQGFPAVLARPEHPTFCSVDVDVADGQFLDVLFADGGRRVISQDQLCRDAVAVAEEAMKTLLRR